MEYMGYIIQGDGVFSYQKINLPKGGTLPAALRGYFTTTAEATKAIHRFKRKDETISDRPVLKTKHVSAKKKAEIAKDKPNGRTKGSTGNN